MLGLVEWPEFCCNKLIKEIFNEFLINKQQKISCK